MSDTIDIDIEQEAKRLARREGWRRRLPLLPALIFTIIVTQVPFVMSLYYSLTEWRVNPPAPRTFIGFDNYTGLWDNRFFRDAAWTSITMTLWAVVLSVLLGLGMAVLLDRKFFGRSVVRTMIITPFLVMPVVASLIWQNSMFDFNFGVINWLLDTAGFERIEFVSRYPFWAVVTVLVWQWTPFMMLILLAGLQGQDQSVLEAARVDGASSRSIFFQITLPQLRPFLELGTLLGAIYLIQVFDHIRVITGGGPESTNVPYFVFQRSIGGGWRFGESSAMSVVVVVATIIIATFSLRVLSNLLEGDE